MDEVRLSTRALVVLVGPVDGHGGRTATHADPLERLTAGTVGDHVGRFRLLADAGVHTVIVSLADLEDERAVERFAPVIEAFMP